MRNINILNLTRRPLNFKKLKIKIYLMYPYFVLLKHIQTILKHACPSHTITALDTVPITGDV